MTRRTWLWAAVVGVPLTVAGGLVYANSQKAGTYTCPITGEQLPCEKCCPLNGEAKAEGYTCPISGDQLPCEKCCPLNGEAKAAEPAAKADQKQAKDEGYICPITGEELGCPGCCPLNQNK